MEQSRFDFPRDEDEPRRKRYRRRKPLPPPRTAAPAAPALVEAPVVQRCGFCGDLQTLLGETGVCTNCGGILLRREDDD